MKKKLISVGFFSELKHGRPEGGSLRASLQPAAGPGRAARRLSARRQAADDGARVDDVRDRRGGRDPDLLDPMLFSAEARSFYMIGAPAMRDYSVGGDCKLQIGSAAPETFACVGSMLQLPTATLDLATTQQATVLDGVTAPGRYTY
jgi:hypothetical protein